MLIYLAIFAFTTILFRQNIKLSNIFLNSMEYILLNVYVPFVNYLYKINLKPFILNIKKLYISEYNDLPVNNLNYIKDNTTNYIEDNTTNYIEDNTTNNVKDNTTNNVKDNTTNNIENNIQNSLQEHNKNLDINNTNIKSMLSAVQNFSTKMFNEDVFNNPEKFITESQNSMLTLLGNDNLKNKLSETFIKMSKGMELLQNNNIKENSENIINNLIKEINLDDQDKEKMINDLKIRLTMINSSNNSCLIDEKLD